MANQIDDFVKRPMRYQNVDGLNELGAGVIWTGLVLLLLLRDIAPSGSIWHTRAAFAIGGVVLLIVVRYCQRILKKRITYPRTGYVKYRQSRARANAIACAVGVAAASAVWLIVVGFDHHPFEAAQIASASVGWGATYVILTRIDAAWRWAFLGALTAVPPIVATLSLSHLWLDIFLSDGLILTTSGVIALTFYLRENPVPEQVAE